MFLLHTHTHISGYIPQAASFLIVQGFPKKENVYEKNKAIPGLFSDDKEDKIIENTVICR